jgi:RNA polymerase sigma-70 factor, ECF subfamily
MNNLIATTTQGAFKLAMQLLHQAADAYDVLQDAAAIAISHPNAPKPESDDFKPWFYRVVRNKSIDRLRQLKRQNHEQLNDESLNYHHNKNPEYNLETSQLQQEVHHALAQLSVEQREIILLKDFHDFSYKAIAEILSIPKGSVMSKLHRARLALKALLQVYQ